MAVVPPPNVQLNCSPIPSTPKHNVLYAMDRQASAVHPEILSDHRDVPLVALMRKLLPLLVFELSVLQVEVMTSMWPSDHQGTRCPTSPTSRQDNILPPSQVPQHSTMQNFNAKPGLMFQKLENLGSLPRKQPWFFPKFQ